MERDKILETESFSGQIEAYSSGRNGMAEMETVKLTGGDGVFERSSVEDL